jgi:hypothetical protein
LGLSDLVDKLLNEASWEEITSTIQEDIELQIRSKFNNQRLAEENRAYHALIEDATKAGKAKAAAEALQTYATVSAKLKGQKERQAQKDADNYYSKLIERAKEQARIKADSKFARLLADERSALAPRVDKEIKEEHIKLIEERRLATVAQLNALTLEEEKKLVLAAAARLGMSITNDEPATKKTKVDQRKARPAPITPRGRSNSMPRYHLPNQPRASEPTPHQRSRLLFHFRIERTRRRQPPPRLLQSPSKSKQNQPRHQHLPHPPPRL